MTQGQSGLDEAQRVLIHDPAHAAALHQVGVQLRDKRNSSRAVMFLFRAVRTDPQSIVYIADALYTSYFTGKKDAVARLKALVDGTAHPHAATLLALLHGEMRCSVEARLESARAITLHPGAVIPYSKKAVAMMMIGDRATAKQALTTALKINPEWLEAIINQAYLLEASGEHEQALTLYLKAINQDPTIPESYFNASICYLALGRFQEGWEWYRYRWSVNSIVSFGADYRLRKVMSTKPQFDGTPVPRLLVWREQGLGDEIMFSSVVCDAASRTSNLLLTCDPRLSSIFQRSFPTATVIADGCIVDESLYDAHIPMGDLPSIFRNAVEDFPKKSGYLTADVTKATLLRERLASSKRKIVGLSWRSINVDNGIERTMSLADFLNLPLKQPVSWVNLQYDYSEQDNAIARAQSASRNVFLELPELDKRNDLEAVAALICACDVVVSIGNSVAHLAGALGKAVIVLVPTSGSWRWRSKNNRPAWYSSAQVIQKRPGDDWDTVLKQVTERLNFLLFP